MILAVFSDLIHSIDSIMVVSISIHIYCLSWTLWEIVKRLYSLRSHVPMSCTVWPYSGSCRVYASSPSIYYVCTWSLRDCELEFSLRFEACFVGG